MPSKFAFSPELVFALFLSALLWVSVFLLIARKKIAAGIVFGIAAAGYSIKTAINAFNADQLGSAAVWASISIAVLVGVTFILLQLGGKSVPSESE